MLDFGWMDLGACKGENPSLWHPEFPSEEENRAATARAVRICKRCPVIEECRSYALDNEPYGTWGALPEDRRELQRYKSGQTMLMPVKVRERYPLVKDLRN